MGYFYAINNITAQNPLIAMLLAGLFFIILTKAFTYFYSIFIAFGLFGIITPIIGAQLGTNPLIPLLIAAIIVLFLMKLSKENNGIYVFSMGLAVLGLFVNIGGLEQITQFTQSSMGFSSDFDLISTFATVAHMLQ